MLFVALGTLLHIRIHFLVDGWPPNWLSYSEMTSWWSLITLVYFMQHAVFFNVFLNSKRSLWRLSCLQNCQNGFSSYTNSYIAPCFSDHFVLSHVIIWLHACSINMLSITVLLAAISACWYRLWNNISVPLHFILRGDVIGNLRVQINGFT